MGRCKEIEIKVIPSSVANPFVKRHHYSGKVVNNSQLHFGAFLDGNLHGVLSYGPSLDKKKVIGLVEGTPWNGFLELNRMAFDDYLPRNSESYCIGATLRMIRKQAPQVKWVVSFADGTQCGDGTIYRASNFILTGININKTIILMPDGSMVAGPTLDKQTSRIKARYDVMCGLDPSKSYTRNAYIMGGGGGYERLPVALHLFPRPEVAQEADRPGNPLLENRRNGRGNVQRRKRNKRESTHGVRSSKGKEK